MISTVKVANVKLFKICKIMQKSVFIVNIKNTSFEISLSKTRSWAFSINIKNVFITKIWDV